MGNFPRVDNSSGTVMIQLMNAMSQTTEYSQSENRDL